MRLRLTMLLAVIALVAAACGDDTADTTTTAAPATTTTAAATTTTEEAPPADSPSSLRASEQDTEGDKIIIGEASLPSRGFIAIHSDADGAPGPVIGHSELLAAGDHAGIEVTLDTPLEVNSTLWPMIHIDMDGNGEYEFMPPDNAVDTPGRTADGGVAVIPVEMTIAVRVSAIVAEAQESDGTAITLAEVHMAQFGFVAVHAERDGAPGPVIGVSGLLPRGVHRDVVITLDEPLEGSTTLFPMVHVDINNNGVYEFNPPDEVIDTPDTDLDGKVVVVPVDITVG